MTSLIYPVVVSWTWGGGWLGDANNQGKGFHDFAGSGVIHMVGGAAGFAGAWILGPRHGKERNKESRKNVFDQPGTSEWLAKFNSPDEVKWYVNTLQNDDDFEINSFPFVVFGTFQLVIGWLFFNAGSTMNMFQDRGNNGPKIIIVTLLSSAFGGIVSAFFKPIIMGTYSRSRRYDVNALANGMLAGCVSVTGVCDRCEPWSAFLIGVIGGMIYDFSCKIWARLDVDDPI